MKVTVITDESGKLLGAIRAETIKDGDKTISFVALPQKGHKHHHLDVAENFLKQPSQELERALHSLVTQK